MKHDFLDRYSQLDSFIHRLDPRTKLVTIFAVLIVIVSEPRGELKGFVFYYPLIFALIWASRLPLVFMLKRCAIASPFILMAAAFLPLSFSMGGDGFSAGVTSEHISIAISVLLKAYCSILLLVILTSTERFHKLLSGLRSLKMPSVIAVISALMYRYIFILNDERLKIKMAQASRTPGKLRINRFKVFGNYAAMLFLRSWQRAQVVYTSMLSRGFTGDFPDLKELHWNRAEGAFGAVFLLVFLAIRIAV